MIRFLFFILCLPVLLSAASFEETGDVCPAGAPLVVRGSTLFALGGSDAGAKNKALFALDLTNPVAPVVRASVALAGFPQDMAFQGKIAYIVDGLRFYAVDTDSMNVLSVTEVSQKAEEGPRGVAVSGNRLFLACGTRGVLTYDVANPSKPVKTGEVKTKFARGVVAFGGKFLAVADDTAGIAVTDGKSVLSRYALPHGSAAKVRVLSGKLYAACGTAFLVVFRWNPDGSLTEEGGFSGLPEAVYYGSYCYDVFPESETALLAGGENGVLCVNPSARTCVNQVKELNYPQIRGVVSNGDFIYANDGGYVVHTIGRFPRSLMPARVQWKLLNSLKLEGNKP